VIGLTGVLIVAAGTAAYRLIVPNNGLMEQSSIQVADLWPSKSEGSHGETDLETVDDLEDDGTLVETDDRQPLATQFSLSNPTQRLIVSTGGVGLAVAAHLGAPWLIPVSLAATVYLAMPIFKEFYQAVFKDRKVKVDVLDATVISLCLLFSLSLTFLANNRAMHGSSLKDKSFKFQWLS